MSVTHNNTVSCVICDRVEEHYMKQIYQVCSCQEPNLKQKIHKCNISKDYEIYHSGDYEHRNKQTKTKAQSIFLKIY